MTRVQKIVLLAIGVGVVAGATAGLVAGVLVRGEAGRPRVTESKRPPHPLAKETVGYMNGIWVDVATWDPNNQYDDTGDEWAIRACRDFRFLGNRVAPRGEIKWEEFLELLEEVITYGQISSTSGIADAANELKRAVDRDAEDLEVPAASMLVACERAGT